VRTDRQTHRQTDRHTPMTTRPCGLRRAGNDMDNIDVKQVACTGLKSKFETLMSRVMLNLESIRLY